ncbi:PIN domain-containing protein [Nonomuraea africana]|uniref:Nucleic acid-binding protein n=1 Tax=Nonomuraea africana TaxID=46171 RepID=A0ABR9KLN3_9ACTN|nr:PIN domain nuclease [Nonomuraea africana]MBE1562928.1 putative nucleic acid-binding protein [Nonomuraea africana]
MDTDLMERFVLDSGALIQLERGNGKMIELLAQVIEGTIVVTIPRTVLAEVWRGGPRQARLAALLKLADAEPANRVVIDELTRQRAKEIGKKIGSCGHDDIVDVNVALCGRNPSSGQVDRTIVTADKADLIRVDPELRHAISVI